MRATSAKEVTVTRTTQRKKSMVEMTERVLRQHAAQRQGSSVYESKWLATAEVARRIAALEDSPVDAPSSAEVLVALKTLLRRGVISSFRCGRSYSWTVKG